MEPKKLQESYAPFRALMETPVILSIGRCPMLMALSPLGSKIAEIYLNNYLVSYCRFCEFTNLRIHEFTVLCLLYDNNHFRRTSSSILIFRVSFLISEKNAIFALKLQI